MVNNNVFNIEKTQEQYNNTSLFFHGKPGLFDTVNKKYPKIWALYKEMKSLDWDESEVDYSQCNADFKNCPQSVSDMMIRTLAWQWEADSVASRAIAPVLAPFISSSELWAAWQRISDNEVIHAAAYSEIVRMSFDNPSDVLADVLSIKESIVRLSLVAKGLEDLYIASHKYALGLVVADQETYNILYKGIVSLFFLERIQFMSSFAITFTIADSGWFQPIGAIVKKIAQDELEIHCELDKAVLESEHKTTIGSLAKEQTKAEILKMFNEVVEGEFAFVDYLFSEGRSLVGTNSDIVKQWVLFNAKDVAHFLNLQTEYKFPKTNPMPHLEMWLNMNKQQAAPQEQDVVAYKVGIVMDNIGNSKIDVDF
ncbi:MAG: ribonucleotide-diphosphate reductase subunit beta [Rickettsiales bacterium]|nr:ribonucleotide-diphosphate reductase subunit beta [Rickettsiales bacterium]